MWCSAPLREHYSRCYTFPRADEHAPLPSSNYSNKHPNFRYYFCKLHLLMSVVEASEASGDRAPTRCWCERRRVISRRLGDPSRHDVHAATLSERNEPSLKMILGLYCGIYAPSCLAPADFGPSHRCVSDCDHCPKPCLVIRCTTARLLACPAPYSPPI